MGNRFSDIVDVDKKGSHVVARRAERFALWPRAHLTQPAAQGVVDDVLQILVALASQALKLDRHVVLDRQCGSHTSKHKYIDVLMSRAVRPDLSQLRYAGFLMPNAALVPPVATLQHVVVTTHNREGAHEFVPPSRARRRELGISGGFHWVAVRRPRPASAVDLQI